MKIERTRNATRNIVFGTILKIYQIIGPFLLRTVFIYFLGMEYLGLNSLFTSVLQVLNLAELGVGSALVFSMYKPIAEDDTEKICALMNLYKRYYRIIGLVVLVAGLVLLPFIPKVIAGSVPSDINIYTVYVLNLATTVASYWMFAFRNCLLAAHQRNDIVSKISFCTSTAQYIAQAVLLVAFRNYYLYLIIALCTQILTNIITAIITRKMYREYSAEGQLKREEIKEINQRVKDLFTAKFGSVIVNSADSVVISAFLGLSLLAVYNNYYYIMSSIMGFISIIFNSCMGGIGNSIIIDSLDKNYHDFRLMTFVVGWILAVASTCFMCLYQPFMLLWVGEKNIFNIDIVILFVIYFFVCELAMVWATYKDAAGIWHEDRFRPLISASTNLVLNIFFVKVVGIGIHGILLSTIISYVFIAMPWMIVNLSNILFKRSLRKYLLEVGGLMLVTSLSCALSYFCCYSIRVEGVLKLVINLCICLIISNMVLILSYCRTEQFCRAKQLVKVILNIKRR